MNKKKQIEEMAGIVKLARDFAFDTVQKILKEPNKYLVIYAGETVDSLIAEYLYEAGYRKVSENEIVISKEEYSELKELLNQDIALFALKQAHKIELNKLRKETAKEIFEKLKQRIDVADGITSQYEVVSFDTIKEVFGEYCGR